MGARHKRRLCGVVALVGAAFLLLVAIQGAAARVAHDPCGENPHKHVASHGLHCGAIFEIRGHHTWYTPGHRPYCCDTGDAPPRCPHGEEIPRFWYSPGTAEWNYWTKEGKWVLWDGGYHEWYAFLAPHYIRKYVFAIWPRFHNWGSSAWPVRVYFYCKKIQ